jgi:hypothetical protein
VGFVLLLSAVMGTAWVAGCGDDETNASTSGAGGNMATTTSTVMPTTTITTTTTTGGGPASFVGRACDATADCGMDEGATCFTANDDVAQFAAIFDPIGVGGPANGYCSKTCAGDTDCPTDAACVTAAGGGVCMLRCTYGEPALEFLDDAIPANKCHGREDVACRSITGGVAVCAPECGADVECGARQCDPGSKLCVDTPATGLELGTGPCVQGDTDPCAGLCLNFVDMNQNVTSTFCTEWCAVGGSLQTDLDCGGVNEGICVFRGSVNGVSAGVGDAAWCTNSCATQGECYVDSGFHCYDIGLFETLGQGYCFGATDCPLGNECDPDEICVTTTYGPVCLENDGNGDPLIPLGTAAPGGAGGAGGVGGAGGAGGIGGAGGMGGMGGIGGAGGMGGN